ncbi:RhoGAP domain containing protein [Histomonas meleagridis]|uniref:RhoGAP domain containing protein n=1 Tax=Histomonas meleagridis TaxID=135588 RepID=UPI00355AB9BF|nr:RhoGAP domain containing protein [Histomonas meleagridis]KAH0805149.1 RhoGAP domain containing protein [Histomonas meleagridis]
MSEQDEIHDFLAYKDEDGQYYYYDSSDSSVSYEFPSYGFIFDPNTKSLLHVPPGNWVDENDKPIVFRSKIGIPEVPKEDSKINPPRESVIELSLELSCIVSTPLSLLRASANVQKEKAKDGAAPPSFDRNMFLRSIDAFNDPDFRERYFKQHKKESIFFRKMYSFDNVIKFTSKPITKPILCRLPRDVIPIALKAFKCILKYSRVITIKKNADEKADRALTKLVMLLCQYTALRDEVFFQLISQTTNTPNQDILRRTWELFLVVASLFPSTRDSQLYILSHIAHTALDENESQKVKEMAQLAYIRFESRCCIGRAEDYDVIEQNGIKELFETDKYSKQFNTSIYEIMWSQRKKVPLCPIPYILYYMTQLFINKNGLREEGIFIEPGQEKLINLNANMANEDMSCLQKMNLYDLCALIKLWFQQLTNSIIPMSFLPEFNLLCENGKYLNIPNALPKTHMHTLMYLTGFLQHIVKFEKFNKLGSNELANIFGPLLVKTTETEPNRIASYKKNASDFLYQLIEGVDTSVAYPLNYTLLR